MSRFGKLTGVVVVGAMSVALLSACGGDRGAAAGNSPQYPAQQATSPPSATRSNEKLMAAAEPFEVLTEQAFDAPMTELAKTRADAQAKAELAKPALHDSASLELTRRLSDLDLAFKGEDRAAIAIASVESYRVLVSGQDAAAAKAPIEVSLLDYAGFKYDAHLKSQPTRWDEMGKDTAFAKTTWSKISGQITSPGLRGAFEAALSGMEAGVAEKNPGLAKHSAETELALVDLLEEHLARR